MIIFEIIWRIYGACRGGAKSSQFHNWKFINVCSDWEKGIYKKLKLEYEMEGIIVQDIEKPKIQCPTKHHTW